MVHIKTNHQEISMLNSLFTLLIGQNTLRDELILLKEKPQSDNSKGNEVSMKEKETVNVENVTYAEKAAKKKNGKSKNIKQPERKNPYNSERNNTPSQVLVVGDSHVLGLDRKAFEKLTKTNADIAITYTTDSDEDAKYPEFFFSPDCS